MAKNFFFLLRKGIKSFEAIALAKAYSFLSEINDEKSGIVANTYRQNLLTAWK